MDVYFTKKNNDITKDFIEYINYKAYEITGVKEIYHEDKPISSKFGFEGINTLIVITTEGAIHTGKIRYRNWQKPGINDVNVLFGMNAEKLDHSAQENAIKHNLVKSRRKIQ